MDHSLARLFVLTAMLCAVAASGCDDTAARTELTYGHGCKDVACSDHGNCVVAADGPICICDEGYSGDSCSRCADGFALDEAGACAAAPGPGLTPMSCAKNNPCVHGTCDDTTGFLTCECDAGYTGKLCDQCYPGYHEEADRGCVLDQVCFAGSCAGAGFCNDAEGVVRCTCYEGFSGTYCGECHEGFHDGSQGGCARDESCDENDPCGPGGTCDDSTGEIFCACKVGYAGEDCGTCYAGYSMELLGICVLDASCTETSCAGHGECTATGGLLSCDCDAGYAGPTCAVCEVGYHRNADDECIPDQDCNVTNPCVNGTCDASTGVIVCVCPMGYTGERCDACYPGYHDDGGVCVLDRDCRPSSCAGVGVCDDSTGDVQCACPPEYAGVNCDTCAIGHHRDPIGACVMDELCLLDSRCVHGTCDDSTGVIRCDCAQGYSGANCDVCAPGYFWENGVCVLAESCADGDPCIHGTCDDGSGRIVCRCDVGWAGTVCDACYPGYEYNAVAQNCEVPCQDAWDWIRCDGVCVSGLSTSDCGGCGVTCATDETCVWDQHSRTGACVCDTSKPFVSSCNGACTNTRYDENNCGGCGVVCATGKCLDGKCAEPSDTGCGCDTGQDTLCCNASTNSCITADVYFWGETHCGGCGITCAPYQLCLMGQCVGESDACAGGGVCTNGTCKGGSEDGAACTNCPRGVDEVCCGESAGWYGNYATSAWYWDYNWDQDVRAGCGQCGVFCGANQVCQNYECVCPSETNPDLAFCYGSCISVAFDANNCGECGHICDTAGGERCLFGVCAVGDGVNGCNGACTGQALCCTSPSGSESCVSAANLATSEAHCGACPGCLPGETCLGGECGCTGHTVPAYCGTPSTCVDLADEPNCGQCGVTCDDDETCSSSGGGPYRCQCPTSWSQAGFARCGGVCADLATNEQHCGACGHACAAGESCIAGTCHAPTGNPSECGVCADGRVCCDKPTTDACALIMTDAANCGDCNQACPTEWQCQAGDCCLPYFKTGCATNADCCGNYVCNKTSFAVPTCYIN